MAAHLRTKISQYWHCIQANLFPWLAEELGPLSDKHQQLVTVLEMIRIEEFIPFYCGALPGRPPADRSSIARAFVAKAVYNLPTTRHLLDRLKVDKILRRICGWEKVNDIAKEWSFSRAFTEFSQTELCQRVHKALIKNYQSERIVGHISRDSTAIMAREKTAKKEPKKKTPKKPRGRPKKGEPSKAKPITRLDRQLKMTGLAEMIADLPTACDMGTKKNSKGYKVSWRGYKLHIDTADGDIPISCILTSASTHDSQVAIPLATMTAQRVNSLYDVMDAAYDSWQIREHSRSIGHVPLIDFNHRSKSDTRTFAPHEAQRYKERISAERVNSRLKDSFNAAFVRVKGDIKVMTHLMFGVLALTVDQLMHLAT